MVVVFPKSRGHSRVGLGWVLERSDWGWIQGTDSTSSERQKGALRRGLEVS